MTGLQPKTRYYYRVGDASGGYSAVNSFKTLSPTAGGATPLRIAWVADMGWGGRSTDTIARLTNLTNAGAIDLLVHPGDIGYADGNMLGWDMYLRKIEPIAAAVPYLTTPGNHELWFNFGAYKHRFFMADDGAHQSMYYSLDVGAVHLLGINTESPLDVAEVDETQREWIAEDLRRAATSTARRWTIAFGHRPLYTTEHRASKRGTGYLQAQLEDMFVASGVDLVVQGHVHAYQRTLPVARGVPTAKDYQSPRAPVYIVNGGAGNREANEVLPMGLPWEPAPNASAGELPLSNEISFGISTISADGIRWEQLYSSNGTRFDHFHIAK